jgi:two-component system, chemotaxis family, chemotaxis protein CheY
MMAKILVIDDSATSRESISFVLKNAGHDVEQAENGLLGLEKYKETKDYSMIFCDVNMPQMNGIEFLTNLRKISRDVPVVVLTTETDKDKIETAKNYKASAWILKPFRQEDLLAVVKKILG